MSLADDFPDEMAQSVLVTPCIGYGPYGPIYGDPVTYDCHVKQKVKNIIDKTGTEAVSHCQIYLDGSVSIGNDDLIEYDGASPPILRVDTFFDERGGLYATVVFT
jgi:hypothetical protein